VTPIVEVAPSEYTARPSRPASAEYSEFSTAQTFAARSSCLPPVKVGNFGLRIGRESTFPVHRGHRGHAAIKQRPERRLLEQLFWLDASDPHRTASAIQTLTRPLRYDVGAAAGRVFKDENWRKALQRVVTENVAPERAVAGAIARIEQLVNK
jgi:hypothetical protein